jgi:hypothetical protein
VREFFIPARTTIGVRAGTKNSLFFVYYVGISMKVFAVGVSRWSYFLASEYGTFLLVIHMNLVIQNGPSTYVIEKTSFINIKVDTRVARELSYTRREILIFYVGQKISGRIYAPIGLKLLSC